MRRKRPADTPTQTTMTDALPAGLAAHDNLRLARLAGMLLALLIGGIFRYPSMPFPLNNGVLCAALWLGSLGVVARLAWQTRGTGPDPRAGDPCVAMALFCLSGLALWAALRWWMVEVRFAGRPWVIDLQWLALAFVLGAGMPAIFRGHGVMAPLPWVYLRRYLSLLTLCFAGYAIYQHQAGYQATLAEFNARVRGPVADLYTQSMLHALSERRVSGWLGNPNLFAAQLAIFSVFCLAALQRGEGRGWRVLGVAGWFAALVGVILSGSRGGVLTLVAATAACVGLLLLDRPRPAEPRRAQGNAVMKAIPILVILIALAYCAAIRAADGGDPAEGGGLLDRLGRIDTIRERGFYWLIAWRIFAAHPLIGAGPGSFILRYATLKPDVARESQYAHSWLFQGGAELGLIGLALICLFWALLLWKFLHCIARLRAADAPVADSTDERPPFAEARWLLLASLLLAFNGLFEFSLQWREFLMALGLLSGGALGLLAGARPTTGPGARSGGARVVRYLAIALPCANAAVALWLTPSHQLALENSWRGKAWQEEGELAEALTEYARAIRREPDDPAYQLQLGAIFEQLGRPADAWRALERAAEANPYSAGVRAEQAQWLIGHGRESEALAYLDQAVERYPSNAGHRLARAELLMKLGQQDRAREDLLFLRDRRIPIWEYEQPRYEQLCHELGIKLE